MKNLLQRVPDALLRLVFMFAVVVGGALVVVKFVIPPHMKDTEIQWADTIEREIARPVAFAGAVACAECHDDLVAEKRQGYHRDLSCETCHGPAHAHTEDPESVKPPSPRDRKFCPLCHTFNPSRPRGFPMINPVAHNPLKPCITCHDPHDPKPPTVPRECSACHGEIARTLAVSHHVQLKCTTCHTTPSRHRVSPRVVKPTKPDSRDFCGKCHGKDSAFKGAPRVDMARHGEKYVCWQCHYPHLPEAD
jgi:DnaJ-class molecular chaperone